ncbi:hypothetical protein MoryE10_11310 [Methylogaea oryzae]|uniref:Uncharacterized protein n=1 Tax=Methylogaea oryzae TaxID=1295382 RepID=A0A8D4VQE4_9GAMM|nr:hypothetical protein MoryE10_11310 [Methylogaea oryzae]
MADKVHNPAVNRTRKKAAQAGYFVSPQARPSGKRAEQRRPTRLTLDFVTEEVPRRAG